MKGIGIFLIVFSLLSFPLFSQIVSIPDTAFLNAVIEEGVDTNEDSFISSAEAEAVHSWGFSWISDFSGTEDTISPIITIISPVQDSAYFLGPEVKITVEEANFKYTDPSFNEDKVLTFYVRDIVFTPGFLSGPTKLLVISEDSSGNISMDSVSFLVYDIEALAIPQGLIATNITRNFIDIIWTYRDDAIHTGFKIYVDDNLVDTSYLKSYTVQGLDPGTNYTIAVAAYHESGLGSPKSDTIQVTTLNDDTGEITKSSHELLLIYPNPTHNFLTIETVKSELNTIEITSLNGQSLFIQTMEGPSHQINLSFFQKGLYFITVRSRDYVSNEKIIKI